jgi:hypothetical protein
MLSDAAVALIESVFERQNLFASAPRIRKRIVVWGPNAKPALLDHSAIAISEEQLLKALGNPPAPPNNFAEPDFTIRAAGDLACRKFGSRSATASPIALQPEAEPDACKIESLDSGWLFTIPAGGGKAWLLSVGPPGAGTPAAFPVMPRIAESLTGPSWLACGSAAMAFDPICGDGTAHAIREAILAAAVIKAIANGGDAASLRAHYEARLTAGFARHLANCLPFYTAAASGPWWQNEANALREGLAWCEDRIPPFQYRLNGFDLEPLS